MDGKKLRRKRLCKWSRGDIKEERGLLRSLVDPPRYVCRSCGRVAKNKTQLCKPLPLED